MSIFIAGMTGPSNLDAFLASMSDNTGTIPALDGQAILMYTPEQYISGYDPVTNLPIYSTRNGTTQYQPWPAAGDGRVSTGLSLTSQQEQWIYNAVQVWEDENVITLTPEEIALWPTGGSEEV